MKGIRITWQLLLFAFIPLLCTFRVMAYTTIDSDQIDYTFHSNETYLIAEGVYFSGTVTFESGSILKYGFWGGIELDADCSIIFPEDGQDHVIFTTANDDSVGESIEDSTGNPSPDDVPATYLNVDSSGAVTIRNADFRHGSFGVDYSGERLDLWNCEFVHCLRAIGSANGDIYLHNVLFGGYAITSTGISYGVSTPSGSVTAEQTTMIAAYLWNHAPPTFNLTNCIVDNLIGSIPSGPILNTNCILVHPTNGTFRASGSYYLTTNSPYRDVGTTDIDPILFSKIRWLTTYAFEDGGYVDNDGFPDLGYHFLAHKAVRPGFEQFVLGANDDGYVGPVDLPFVLNYFGMSYSNLFVNNNGNVTFAYGLSTYTPEPLVDLGLDIIAPFWADVDTRGSLSDVVRYGTNTINGRIAFGVTWNNVGYYGAHDDKLNSFQLTVIDRNDRASGDYDVEFNYDRILWETGDASSGSNGFGGSPARAGYASQNSSTFELSGSGISLDFLDSNFTTGLIHGSFNSTVLGRYVFQFHNGVPVAHP